MGSGTWVSMIKDRSTLTRTIIKEVDTVEELLESEQSYLDKHFGKPNCMNASPDCVGFTSDNNPMYDPAVAAKIAGDNHWTRKNPDNVLTGDDHWMNQKLVAKEKFLETCYFKSPENRKRMSELNKVRNVENNPSTKLAAEGKHHWQHGKSPNANGKLNKKLIEEGRHNLTGPEHNRKMIAEGKNPWVGPKGNLDRLANGTHPSQQKKTCEHCDKEFSIGMYKRWHGDNCKLKSK